MKHQHDDRLQWCTGTSLSLHLIPPPTVSTLIALHDSISAAPTGHNGLIRISLRLPDVVLVVIAHL